MPCPVTHRGGWDGQGEHDRPGTEAESDRHTYFQPNTVLHLPHEMSLTV